MTIWSQGVTISGDICITHRNLSVLPSASETEVVTYRWPLSFVCGLRQHEGGIGSPLYHIIGPCVRWKASQRGFPCRRCSRLHWNAALARWQGRCGPLPREIFSDSQLIRKFLVGKAVKAVTLINQQSQRIGIGSRRPYGDRESWLGNVRLLSRPHLQGGVESILRGHSHPRIAFA